MTRNEAFLSDPAVKEKVFTPRRLKSASLWTDDHVNLLEVLQ